MIVTKTIDKIDLNKLEDIDREEYNQLIYGDVFFSCDNNTKKCDCANGCWLMIVLPLTKNGDSESILIEFTDSFKYFKFKEKLTSAK